MIVSFQTVKILLQLQIRCLVRFAITQNYLLKILQLFLFAGIFHVTSDLIQTTVYVNQISRGNYSW